MSIEPLENRIVIKPFEEKVKPGGIIIPTEAKEKSMEGTVIAVGPGINASDGSLIVPQLNSGDIVLYSKFVGTEVIYEGENLLIMKESDVLARLKKA